MNRFIFLFLLTVVSCVTSNNSHKTFNKYLTENELEQLKEEKVIDKIHTSYRKNGQIHWTGPLKVRMIDEELQFTKYGIWKGFYEAGELLSEAVINSKGQIVHEKIYEKEGTLTAEIIGYDETSRGELVRKEKIINYYIDSNKDTLNIKTFTINGDKSIQDGIEKHFDRNGKVIKLIEYKDGEEQKNNS